MKIVHIFLSVGLIVSSPEIVIAQDLPTDAVKPKKEKKICRKLEVTGSMLGQSICHTEAQWREVDARNSESSEGLLRRNSSDSTTR